MSVFRVQLNNAQQGLLDTTPAGARQSTSYQRQVYVMGPHRINRLLNDGETFTDCNYWKRFAYPQVPLEQAFIQVVTDDGSVYSDTESENVYPYVFDITAAAGTAFASNVADILTTTGGYAVFCQITNTHASQDVQVRLNGKSTAVFTLVHNTAQVFNAGDLSISKVEVANTTSGGDAVAVEVLCSIKSVATS